ncbi:Centromere protein 3 [Grifola frondosa]|uniref:CENP-C homolog n=1 Tax=Grifola frondosa TaxID=5627 RepID=A0A1C7LSM2_GRIFR|nr:Centromere protein 3 [Grifola frondosa]
MPVSARKSSLGASRRGVQRYIPYRADDFQHGKKTGIAVAYVDHKSDEFEPFDKVIGQADQRTPPKVQGVRKKRAPKTPIVEEPDYDDDENGEMSMELEDSIPNSPSAYFTHTRMTAITSSVQRVGSSSRPVARSSDVDFDKVPSPRASSGFSSRKSLANGHSARSPGPSRLSQSTVVREEQDGGPNGKAPTPRRTSFTRMDQEADQEDEEQVEDAIQPDSPQSAKARGKQRASRVQPPPDSMNDVDEGMEDEIAQGLAEMDMDPMDMEVEEDQQSRKKARHAEGGDEGDQPASKKARKENEGTQKRKGKPRGKKENILREVTPEDPNAEDGLRRSKRPKIRPLEWWRLEKVVYGRRQGDGKCMVPTITEIRRIPKEEPVPLGSKYKKKRPPRSKSKTMEAESEPEQVLVYNPEEGWDDQTQSDGVVIDYDKGEEVLRRIAFTAKMVQPKPAANSGFYFQKIFGEGDFIAAGQLVIPSGGEKPTKGTKDNTFVFYVIEGAVNFRVNRTSYVIASGGMFLVPRGNMYFIQNISDREAKLFFAQARKVLRDEEEGASDTQGRSRSRSEQAGRRSSVGESSENRTEVALAVL